MFLKSDKSLIHWVVIWESNAAHSPPPYFLFQVHTWCLDKLKMRKHRHLPLVAIFCLFLSGFSLTRAQQQAGKIQNCLLKPLWKEQGSLISDLSLQALAVELRDSSRSQLGWSLQNVHLVYRPQTLYPVRDGLLLLELGFDILKLVQQWLVLTKSMSRKFVAQILYHRNSFSTFLAPVGLWVLKTRRQPLRVNIVFLGNKTQRVVPSLCSSGLRNICHLQSSKLLKTSFPKLF